MRLRALIFDVDGTLAETEEAHRRAFNDSFAAAGLDWHWSIDDYRDLLEVTGGKERIAAYQATLAAPVLDAAQIAALHRAKTARYGDILARGELDLRPGVRDLIGRARAAGLQLAVATTTSVANVDALVRCCWGVAATDVFNVIAAGDAVAAKKPAPDVYRLALDQLALPADACLAFEDSLNGVWSAQRAGLRVVVTPGAYTQHQRFSPDIDLRDDLEGFALADA